MALSNINDIVVEYQDIVIVEGDIDYVSIYLTSGTDEGYRKLYELAGLNPDDYEEVKDDPEEIEEFYLQLFATGDMKVNDNFIWHNDKKYFIDDFKKVSPMENEDKWNKYVMKNFLRVGGFHELYPYFYETCLREPVFNDDGTINYMLQLGDAALDTFIDMVKSTELYKSLSKEGADKMLSKINNKWEEAFNEKREEFASVIDNLYNAYAVGNGKDKIDIYILDGEKVGEGFDKSDIIIQHNRYNEWFEKHRDVAR